MPACFITALQRACSSRMNASNAAGVPPSMSAPRSAKLADVRHVQNLDEFGIESLRDRLRRGGRSHDAIPERDVHAVVAKLGERGYVRKQAMALPAGCGQGPKLARHDEG